MERGAGRIRELDRVSAWLAERVVERERELRELRAELARARERGDEGLRALSVLSGDGLGGGTGPGPRPGDEVRLRALRAAAELTQQLDELGGQQGEVRDGLIESLQEAIERVGADAEEEEISEPSGLSAAANGYAERKPGELFEGLVEVEVGPLSDFSQLLGSRTPRAGSARCRRSR